MTATTDPERLRELALELAAASAKPRVRLPVVSAADAAGLVAVLHSQLDAAIDHRSEAATAAGEVIACARGCNACCAAPVAIAEGEAAAVAVWLADHPDVRDQFLAAYPAWRAALGSLVEDIISAGDEGFAAYGARRAMCPFNAAGACTIYPVRPSVCRTAHALGTSAKCADATGEVDMFVHAEVTDTLEDQHGLRTVLHLALRSARSLELLPKAVLRRLVRATAFPNQPCPCGSGAKYKHCCRAD